MQLCIEPGELRAAIRNWLPFAATLLGQIKAEYAKVPSSGLRELMDLIESDPEFKAKGRKAAEWISSPVPTLKLERDGLEVELFTLLSTFGTVTDANLAELRVETFFPANEASRALLLSFDAALSHSPG